MTEQLSMAHGRQDVCVSSVASVLSQLFATPWTVACQAPLFMGFPRLEYWSGLPFPTPGDLPDPGSKCESPALQADSLPSEPPGKPQVNNNALILAHCHKYATLLFSISKM